MHCVVYGEIGDWALAGDGHAGDRGGGATTLLLLLVGIITYDQFPCSAVFFAFQCA